MNALLINFYRKNDHLDSIFFFKIEYLVKNKHGYHTLMDFIRRLLKSAVRTCIQRYFQNEIGLNSMKFTKGVFSMSNFQLNPNEINKQIHQNTDVQVYCDQLKVGNMKIHPSWRNVIQKIELENLYVQLDSECKHFESQQQPSNNESSDSIFYYDMVHESEDVDSLSGSLKINSNDLKVYQGILDRLEQITKEFEAVLYRTRIQYKHMELTFAKLEYSQRDSSICIDLNGVKMTIRSEVVAKFQHLMCVINSDQITITTESSKARVVLRTGLIQLLCQYLSDVVVPMKDPAFSQREKKKLKLNLVFPSLKIQIDDKHTKFQNFRFTKDITSEFELSIEKISSGFFVAYTLCIRSPQQQLHEQTPQEGGDFTTGPFKDQQLNLYCGDLVMPNEIIDSDELQRYIECCLHSNSNTISCTAERVWIDITLFKEFIESILRLKNQFASIFILPDDESDTPPSRDLCSGGNHNNKTCIGITITESLIKYDDFFTFHANDLNGVVDNFQYLTVSGNKITWAPTKDTKVLTFKSKRLMYHHHRMKI